MSTSLTRPEPRRIVPRAVVDALIADADREISSLELHVERALAAADGAEARLAELGVDERASAWATVQLERFVTELRADAYAESVAVVEEARARARLLVEEAESEIRRLRLVASTPPPEPAYEPSPVEAALFGDALEVAVAEPAAREGAATPEDPAPAPPVPVDADGDAVFHQITPEALATDGDSPAPLDPQFWPTEAERKRRFPRPRVRTMAAPALAGLLVVAAVVVRVV